jgi:signal transduction histidine kinase/FixJ family two-component response regulator
MTAWIDRCLPLRHRQGPHRRLARLTLLILVFLNGLNAVTLAVQLLLAPSGWEYTAAQWLVVYPAAIIAFYACRSIAIPVHILTGALAAAIFGLCLALGGIETPVATILLVLPLLPMVLIGRRSGVAWGLVIAVCVVVLATVSPLEPIIDGGRNSVGMWLPPLLALAIIVGTFGFTEASRDQAESSLREARDEAEQARQQADAARAETEAAMQARTHFLSTMSHEIRTPMNGILGMAELLDDAPLEAAEREQVDIIRDAGQSLLRILEDVLDVSRLEADRMVLECVPFDLTGLVKRATRLVEGRIAEKHLDLDVSAGAEEHWVLGDPNRVRQVLLNLLSNAVKFTESGGVTVHAEVEDEGVVLIVGDTGIGMTDTQLDRAFEPFTQGDAGMARRFGGAGLGLAITGRLVECMRGEISVQSQVGSGSVFRVRLPLEPADPPSLDPDRDTAPRTLPELRVLVVEDNATNRSLLVGMLASLGIFDVRTAVDGGAAVDHAGAHRLDVILMDVLMPGIDGTEATQRIRESEREHGRTRVPILAVTANVSTPDRRACEAAGMDGVISKPVRRDALVEALARCTRDPERARYSASIRPAVAARLIRR